VLRMCCIAPAQHTTAGMIAVLRLTSNLRHMQ
jgi:hypothetical protein